MCAGGHKSTGGALAGQEAFLELVLWAAGIWAPGSDWTATVLCLEEEPACGRNWEQLFFRPFVFGDGGCVSF